MKKTFTLLVFALCFITGAQAQQTIFSENFDLMVPPVIRFPWTHTASTIMWQVATPSQASFYNCFEIPGETGSNKVAYIIDCSASGNADISNALLKTPEIDLTGFIHPWVEFDSYFLKAAAGGRTEKATVEVSVDSGNTWTVVDNVPATTDFFSFVPHRVNLSAYGNRKIKLGFRYSDDQATVNMKGWAIDNIRVSQPAQNDLAILKTLPDDPLLSYVEQGQTAPVKALIMNRGLTPVTSFTFRYAEGAQPAQSYTVTGVNLGTFDTVTITHNAPYFMPDDNPHNLQLNVQLPADADTTNNSMALTLRGAVFIPKKVVVVENNTGTWNMYAPRGFVLFNSLAGSDKPVNLISVHGSDPMENLVHNRFLYYIRPNTFNYPPPLYIDRRERVNPLQMLTTFNRYTNHFGFADIDVRVTASTNNSVTVYSEVKPAVYITGEHRLAVVITEEDVSGFDTTWNQRNFYSGFPAGSMGGYEALPNPVPAASMQYDYVSRVTYPTADGQVSSLPRPMLSGDVLPVVLTVPLNPAWNKAKLSATALLIRTGDSVILNSTRIRLFSLAVPNITAGTLSASVYPNPASGNASVSFTLTKTEQVAISVTDLSGRIIAAQEPGKMTAGIHSLSLRTAHLPDGLYLVQVQAGDKRQTLKLTVLH